MKRVDRAWSRTLGILAAVVGALLVTSCLDLETDFRMSRDGSVHAVLTYEFEQDAAEFGRGFGSDEPWPLPLTEKDFRQRRLRHPDVDLLAYRAKTDRNGRETILVRLKSRDLEAMAAYLSLDVRLNGTPESGTLILRVPESVGPAGISDETRKILDGITGGMTFRFRFRPPSRPTESDNGTIDGRYAAFEITMRDILDERAPESWSVSW